jgi:hypothetical protein
MAERFDRHRIAIATALFVAVLLVGAVTQFLPRLTQQGDVVSSTPVRADLASVHPIVLEPGARACLGDVTFDPAVRVAQLTLAPSATGSAPTRLTLVASGPGYRAMATTTLVRGQGGRLDVPISPPRDGVLGTLCVRNDGRHTTALAGTADPRALTRSAIVVDGERSGQGFSVILREAGGRSLLSRTSQIVDRTAALSAVGPWLLWLLIPLLALGMPAAVAMALRLALREPDPPLAGAQPDPATRNRPDRE